MHILLTGATGFVGSHILRGLLGGGLGYASMIAWKGGVGRCA